MIKEANIKKHILEGPVFRSILIISVPVIIANLFQTVYQLIDTFWVGRLGTSAVASVSLSIPILFFLTSLAMGFSIAGSILIAQHNGRGEKEKVNFIAGQTLSLVFVIATILAIIGYFLSHFLLSFLTKDPIVLTQATSYLKISFLAILAMFIYNIFQASLRGVGEVKAPMIIIFISVVINFFIDPLFMFGWRFIPAMGVSGVALATLITEYLSAIIGIVLLFRGSYGISLKLKYLKLKLSWAKKIFKLGLPIAIEMSSRSLSMVLMTFLVSSFGTLIIASYGIGSRMLGFIIIPALGFSIATSSLVGNNLGAKQHSRAEEIVKTGMGIAFWTLSALGILLFIFAKSLAEFFVPNEPQLILSSARFIRIMALSFGFIGVQMVVIGTIKAAGRTTVSMFLSLFSVTFVLALSYLLSIVFKLQELGIWIAYPITNIVSAGIAFYFYKKKKWLNKKLV